ncbi:MAG: PspC domain-containing protein [Bacteroidales bacterium]|jgi:phage shock protein PspC (stress-responsive transcriptional regulator)|nr:PspC domain-containing protein [Bacteroidales bacterium]
MKRVETININGIVFSIDDDAFGKLGSYLDALGEYFEQEQGGREIITDIEARISELFAERNGGTGQVITLADVTKVIQTLGTPEDIVGADADFEAGTATPPQPAQQPGKSIRRRLYRDPDQRYIGGVCSGIAAWLGISPLALRLVFLAVAFFYGLSIAFYALLWIIIPKAKTTAQKLEMSGEPVTISNIEKIIKENLSDPSLSQSFRNFLNEAGEFLGKVFDVSGRILGVLLGLFMLCWGICIAIGLIVLIFIQDLAFNSMVDWDFLSFTELFRHIITPASYTFLLICMILVAVLPVFALIFWGARLIVGFRVKRKLLHVALSVLWVIAIVTGIIVCLSQARNFAWRNDQIVETRQLAPSDTIFLAVAPSSLQISNNPMEVYFDKDNRCFYGKPSLRVHKSEDGQVKLRLNRESQGESKRAAYQYAENIAYTVDARDSALTLDPYFTVTPQDKWKFQTLDVVLYVPEGVIIVADKTLCNDRALGRWLRWRSNADCTWVMTEKNGLQVTDIEK